MRAGFGICTALGLLIFAVSAQGQEIRWQPAGATGNVLCSPGNGDCGETELMLSRGGVTATLFIELSGWDPDQNGLPTLGAFQGSLLASSLDGPGDCDLVPVGAPDMGFEGAYQATKVCGNLACVMDPFAVDCVWDPLSCCTPACGGTCPAGDLSFCIERPDYVYFAMDNTPTVSTATADYSWSAASTVCATDPCGNNTCRFYGGTLLLQVPDLCCPPWNVGFVDDSNFTLMNSCPGPLITGMSIVEGVISMETGRCCYGIGDTDSCEDDVCGYECDALPAPRQFEPGVVCPPTGPDCCACLIDLDCDDGNACTDDWCDNCVCYHAANYQEGIECCDPATGDVEVIDDGNPCSDDICDDQTGIVTHPCNSDPCNDGDGCTHTDTCTDDVDCPCVGTDINTVPCTTLGEGDAACDFGADGAFPCVDTGAGYFCECVNCTTLGVVATPSEIKDDNCYTEGEVVNVTIDIVKPGSEKISGGQFILTWDPTCLDFISMGPCMGSVFNTNPIKMVDADAGTAFYVALMEPFKRCSIDGNICFDAGDCVQDPDAQTCDMVEAVKADALACASFYKLADDCDKCPICLDGENPANLLLSNDEGYRVDLCPIECDAVRLAGDLSISYPDDSEFLVQADCGLSTADITWDTPFAEDTCDDPDPDVACTGQWLDIYNVGTPLMGPDDLVWNGGTFAQGHWWFVCNAENSCGNTAQEVWTVYVKDQHMLDVEVQLAPPLTHGQIQRCIKFELYSDCWYEPTVVEMEMVFGPPENFKHHAKGQIKVAKNNYECITAIDQLHTLRQRADIECVGNAWHAVWKGDPLLGGNWLPGGNLDGYKKDGPDAGNIHVVDVLDFGKFISEIVNGSMYMDAMPTPGSTDCMTEGPHGDINGDGLVDQIDYGIIQMNFLMAKKDECCPDAGAAAPVARTAISIKELRQMGMSDLIVADLNKDGVLDVNDMTAYEEGVVPTQDMRTRKRTR